MSKLASEFKGKAALMAMVGPGLGHLYRGHYGQALLANLVWIGILACGFTVAMGSIKGLIATTAAALLWLVATAVHAGLGSDPKTPGAGKRRWLLILPAILVLNVWIEPILVRFLLPGARYASFAWGAKSMEPTLSEGDKLVGDHRWFATHPIQRQDVVIFAPPTAPECRWAMRCIGLPGDLLEFRDGRLYVNGTRQEGAYPPPPDSSPLPHDGPLVVPDGTIFCLGDNHGNSLDSRHWGPLEMRAVQGKALYIWWSRDLSRIGTAL